MKKCLDYLMEAFNNAGGLGPIIRANMPESAKRKFRDECRQTRRGPTRTESSTPSLSPAGLVCGHDQGRRLDEPAVGALSRNKSDVHLDVLAGFAFIAGQRHRFQKRAEGSLDGILRGEGGRERQQRHSAPISLTAISTPMKQPGESARCEERGRFAETGTVRRRAAALPRHGAQGPAHGRSVNSGGKPWRLLPAPPRDAPCVR